MSSIEQLKALVSRKNGFARSNKFLVTLPSRFGVDGRDLNTLCNAAQLPAKTITTTDRRIGMEYQKIGHTFAVTETTLSFWLLNDYGVKKYFDNWRNATINESTMSPRYKSQYSDTITIHQLSKPIIGYSRSIGPSIFGSQRFRFNASIGGGTNYSVNLLEAFPTNYQQIDMNNELDGLLQFTVEIAYTNWVRDRSPQNWLNFSAGFETPFGAINII